MIPPVGTHQVTLSGAIAELGGARELGAVGAAIDLVVLFDAVADYAAAAVGALGREGMNRALERVEGMGLTRCRDREGLVVLVAADFARSHGPCLPVSVVGRFTTLGVPRPGWDPPINFAANPAPGIAP